MRRILVGMAMFGAAWGLARADIVHLTNGRTLEGDCEEVGDSVRVRTAFGVVTLKRDQIERIEKTKSVADLYAEKLAALPKGNAEAAFNLAAWCKEQGLQDEHLHLVRKALTIDRTHAGALDALRRHLIGAPLKPEPKRVAALEKQFGDRFTVKQSAHYLMVYSCDDRYAAGRIQLLERLYQSFYGYFHDGKFPLMPLRGRLVTVLFGSRREFIRAIGARVPAAMHAGGLYHPPSNSTVFFAAYSDDDVAKAKQNLEKLRRLIAEDRKQVPKLRRELVRARSRNDRALVAQIEAALDLTERRKAEYKRVEQAIQGVMNSRVSIVMHEATHQLVFNTRLLRNPAGDPRWLHEGFATLFESSKDGRWRGLGTPNLDRLADYRRFKAAGQLPRLRNLLVDQEGFMKALPRTLPSYASCWSLLYYLSQRHRTELNAYLRLVAAHKPGPVSAEARIKDFTDAFGDIDELEQDWRAFMDRVKA